MKRIFDFAFCEGCITPEVVWYMVPIGQSVTDSRAKHQLEAIIRGDNRFFFALHTKAISEFLSRVARSVFSHGQKRPCLGNLMLRRKQVPVTQLVRFLRHCPPTLLNSRRVDTGCPERLLLGTSCVPPSPKANVPCLSPSTY